MEIFWRLVFAHLLGDFTFQTNYVAGWKRRSGWGMFFHVTNHPVLYVIFTWPYLTQPWVETPWFVISGITAILIIYAFHWIEDAWRVKSVAKTNGMDNFFYFLWDQAIHLLAIFAFTPKITSSPWPGKWLGLCILLVLVTHFTNIVIYFIEKDRFGYERAGRLLEHKYQSMAERLAVFGCMLLPGLWPLAFPLLFVLQWLRYRFVFNSDLTRLNVIGGNIAALFLGIIARLVI